MSGRSFFLIGFFCAVFFLWQCGSARQDDNDVNNPSSEETIDTQKLIGTPFEGKTSGNEFAEDFFLCGQYRTEKIDSFPIQIFTAFFTDSEEAIIQEGLDLTNDAMGYVAYELTEIWSNDLRVIYSGGTGAGALGRIHAFYSDFNGKLFAEKQAPDWAIGLSSVGAHTVAHELGHASGIRSHALIDYENDTLAELEVGSLMGGENGGNALDDFNFMMERQGQIMLDHLGEVGDIDTDPCIE